MPKAKTLNDYQQLAKSKGGEYILDYIVNTSTKLRGWKCKRNHIWSATYTNIRNKSWCPHCAGLVPKTLEDYQSAAGKHAGKYVLDYIPKRTLVRVKGWKCDQGHLFVSAYNNVANSGQWCAQCYGSAPKTMEDYTALANERKGEYVLDYVPQNIKTIVKGWQCQEGHVFRSRYNCVQQGSWCAICSRKAPKNLDHYQQAAHNMSGLYILDYIPKNIKVSVEGWKCSSGHIFRARYNDVDQGHWCPTCCSLRSETKCRVIFEELMGLPFPKRRPRWLQGLELDGYNKDLKLAFEYQGIQHYKHVAHFHRNGKALGDQQERDRRTAELCAAEGVTLIHIPYTYSYRDPGRMEEYIQTKLKDTQYIINITIDNGKQEEEQRAHSSTNDG